MCGCGFQHNLRRTAADVAELPIRAPDGHIFPLKRVAALHVITGEPEITRQDLKQMVSITGRSDRDLGSTIRDVRAVLDARISPAECPLHARRAVRAATDRVSRNSHGHRRRSDAGVFASIVPLREVSASR